MAPDSALRQYMYYLVMSQHTIHYDMNINELRQCCFDSGDSLTGFVLQPVSLISMASVVQTGYTTPTQWFSVYPLNHLVGVV